MFRLSIIIPYRNNGAKRTSNQKKICRDRRAMIAVNNRSRQLDRVSVASTSSIAKLLIKNTTEPTDAVNKKPFTYLYV